MPKSKKNKLRKPAGSFETRAIKRLRELLSPEKLRAMARRIARTEKYTLPEFIAMLDRCKSKKTKRARGRGRPPIPNKFAILDAAAHAKVHHGRYKQIARDWNLKPEQLSNLVKNEWKYFSRKIKKFRKNAHESKT